MTDRHQFRADWHDYDEGTIFVTVCCAQKQHLLGKITDGKIHLSQTGEIVDRQIRDIPKHFANVDLLNYVVMPNHIHMVITIHPPVVTANTVPNVQPHNIAIRNILTRNGTRDAGTRSVGTRSVGTLFKASDPDGLTSDPAGPASDPASPTTHQPSLGCLKPRRHEPPESQDFHHNSALSIIMRCVKGGVTRDARRLGIYFR